MLRRIFPKEDYPPYELTAAEKCLRWALGLLLGAAAGWLFFRCPAGLLTALPLGVLVRREGAAAKSRRKRLGLTGELREYLLSVLSSLRAGLALENAMRAAGREVRTVCGEDSLMAAEAAVIASRLDLQIPPEELWREFGERCDLEEARELGRIFAVAKRQGGDYTPVLRGMADAMEGRLIAREEIQSLLTGKKLEYEIMCAVPAAILAYLSLAGGDLVAALYETPAGRATALASMVLYGGAVIWGLRILERAFETESRMNRREIRRLEEEGETDAGTDGGECPVPEEDRRTGERDTSGKGRPGEKKNREKAVPDAGIRPAGGLLGSGGSGTDTVFRSDRRR